ncbi:MAG: hypothetical protein M3209_08610 [Acidobacteriota bacterium]|nr:hypothetical protein [Acidobacteriota bacterium]
MNWLVVLLLLLMAVSPVFAQKSKPSANEPKQSGKQSQKSESKKNSVDNSPRPKRMIMSFSNPERMFQILEGRWIFDEKDCANAYTVKVAPDRKTIKFTYTTPQMVDGEEKTDFTYNVLEVGSYYIRAQIIGEKRLTDHGKPVVWDFYFLSNDEFRWRRTDWEQFATTPPVFRCKDKPNSVAQIH